MRVKDAATLQAEVLTNLEQFNKNKKLDDTDKKFIQVQLMRWLSEEDRNNVLEVLGKTNQTLYNYLKDKINSEPVDPEAAKEFDRGEKEGIQAFNDSWEMYGSARVLPSLLKFSETEANENQYKKGYNKGIDEAVRRKENLKKIAEAEAYNSYGGM